jgi:hypothetical protein
MELKPDILMESRQKFVARLTHARRARNFVKMFDLVSDYAPAGDQPQAIAKLTDGLLSGAKHQVLLGVTGSGTSFVIANAVSSAVGFTL